MANSTSEILGVGPLVLSHWGPIEVETKIYLGIYYEWFRNFSWGIFYRPIPFHDLCRYGHTRRATNRSTHTSDMGEGAFTMDPFRQDEVRWFKIIKHALGSFGKDDGYDKENEHLITYVRIFIVGSNLLCAYLFMLNIIIGWF